MTGTIPGTVDDSQIKHGETSLERKLRWFRAGVADFAASFPGLIAERPDAPPVYCCPLCARSGVVMVFPETAVYDGHLTFDHVPPKHSGGRQLVLTCKKCNNEAGYSIDLAALEVENGLKFLDGRGSMFGRLRAAGYSFGADVDFDVAGPHGKIHLRANQEEAITALRGATVGPAREEIHFDFKIRDANDPLAKASWLKSAYLAAFALFGYRYAFSPGLEVVRRQIQEPAAPHIEQFSMRLPIDLPIADGRVFVIADHPELPPAVGVNMGPHLIFLPGDNSGQLYGRISELRRNGAKFEYTSRGAAWPTQPLFQMADHLVMKKREPAPGV